MSRELVCEVCGQVFEWERTGKGAQPRTCLEHRTTRAGITRSLEARRAALQASGAHMTTESAPVAISRKYRNAARKRAEQALGERAEIMSDAIERFARAVEDEMRVRDAWEALGCPATEIGGNTGRNVIAHPLLEEIRKAAAAAAKHAEAVGLGGTKQSAGGRPTGKASAPDRTAEPPRIARIK